MDLGEHHDDIASVLLELGVPLNLVPVSEGFQPTGHTDVQTCALIRELRAKEDQMIRANKFGDAQKVAQHMEQLHALGQELQGLLEQREMLSAARDVRSLEQLAPQITALETKRLHLAALYETDWWLTAMSARFGRVKEGGLALPEWSAMEHSLELSISATSSPAVGSEGRFRQSGSLPAQGDSSKALGGEALLTADG
ncbi:unnamed protein product [Symbiodinium natans]|uniref:Uncharacterized protein n=1 Tax=Symbiodinium natans TaxID=878477 RepID=A0A812KK65_9DINO|nr:unnamed protein product [Symbiodinium natans]